MSTATVTVEITGMRGASGGILIDDVLAAVVASGFTGTIPETAGAS